MAGRKVSWPNKIDAPELVLNLYRAIAAVQSKPELFMNCHVFDGANLKHVPYVTVSEETFPLPKLLTHFLGLQYGKKTCATHACCNPMHFARANQPTPLKGLQEAALPLVLATSLDEYVELIKYYVDKHEVTPTFNNLRGLIPVEDMSDDFLTLSIEKINHV